MARRLSGTSVGIVLSGGGARAFAHIGVLDELAAAGVTIDRIAGVSMGAVIGALYAMGHDAGQIDAICFEEWVQRRPLRDFTIPRHSLIRGQRFQSMLHRTFGTTLIEELPRSFICGSAELRSGRLEIARHGPLRETVGSQNTSEAARRHADLVIRPRAEGLGLLEFGQLDTAREAAREAARRALERTPASLLA